MNIVKRNPTGANEIIEVAPNRMVIDYLEEYDRNFDFETDVYVDNRKLVSDKDFEYRMREGEILTIVYRPSGVDPITVGLIAVTSVLVLLALQETTDTTNSSGETSSSSNNSVSAQSNTVRKYEGIPSICGRVWSYPDLIANAVPQWISNRKQVRELFLIGEGEYQINEARDSTTDIDDIAESSYTVYGPDTYPSDLYRIQFNDSVSSEELIAPDDSSIIWSGRHDFENSTGPRISIGYDTVVDSIASSVSFELGGSISSGFYTEISTYGNPIQIEAGDTIYYYSDITSSLVSVLVSSVTQSGDSVVVYTNQTLVDETTDGGSVRIDRARVQMYSSDIGDLLGLSVGNELEFSYMTGQYEISGMFAASNTVTDFFHVLLPRGETFLSSVTNVTSTVQKVTTNTPNIVGPYTMPTTAEQIWFNAAATSGLQSDSGGEVSVDITFYAQQIDVNGDDVGSPVSETVTFTGSSTTTQGQTVKITDLGGETYKVYAVRETGTYSGNAIQDVYWQEVFTVNSYDGSTFGDVTVVDVTTKANTNGTSSSRQINLDVTREIDGVATTNFADYVVWFITEKGGYSESFINTDELYEIADSLSDDLKEFSYTFDDADLTLAQAVQTICDVARVYVYRDGQEWRFTRDESKARTYIFNRRNLAAGDNQKITVSTRQPQDYDGLSLRYYNRLIEDYDNIYIKIDSDTESFIVGEYGDRLKEIELAGCANYAQALNRAHMEVRKIVYQRKGVEDTALIDASNVDIGERVSWCDIYDGDIFDGEIMSQDGTTFYTSEPIVFESGVTYYALISNEDGESMATVEVTENVDNEKSFIATLSEAILIADGYEIQAGSKYIIGSVDDIDDTDYTVMARGGNSGDGLIDLELVQYNESIYEMD